MTPALGALLAFCGWTLALVLAIGFSRVSKVLAREAPPNSFKSGVPHGSDRYWRLNRAHLNCTENLPIFAAVVLVGTIARVSSSTFEVLPWIIVAARVVQSSAHISSNSNRVVTLRFYAYVLQIACILWLIVEIASTKKSSGFDRLFD